MTTGALGRRVFQSAVAWSFVAIALRMGAALAVLPIVLRKLPTAELGIWYALQATMGVGLLMDFGFGPSFSRFAAYLFAGARELSPAGVSGGASGEPNWSGLADLRATAKRLYVGLAGGAALLVVVGAYLTILPEVMRLPDPFNATLGIALVMIGVTIGVSQSRHGNILAGMGGITQAVRAAVAGSILQLATSFLLVWADWGIAGLGAAYAVGTLTTTTLNRLMLESRCAHAAKGHASPTLLRAMIPSVWRLGVVMVGSYLITQGNTLVCARMLGASATATYGLTLQVVQFAASTCFVFASTKTPIIAQLRQEGAVDSLQRMWLVAMRRSLFAYFIAALAALTLGPYLLSLMHARTTLLPWPQFLALLVIRLLEAHHAAHGTLIVTENRVPFLIPALGSGVAILGLTLALAPTFGLWAIIAVPGVVQACWNNWWTVLRGLRGIGLTVGAYLKGLLGAPRFAKGADARSW